MNYINARNVLPDRLLIEIRKYVQEGFLYIPGIEKRKEWGSISGHKHNLANRNRLIYRDFQNGKTVLELSKVYYLSESSIYRILKYYN